MNGGVVNNFIPNIPTTRAHADSVRQNRSGYRATTGGSRFSGSGPKPLRRSRRPSVRSMDLPDPLATNLGTFQNAPLYRLNYDYTLSPTMLLHFGAGYRSNYFFVPTVNEEGQVPNYNASTALGLNGADHQQVLPAVLRTVRWRHRQLLHRPGRHDEFRQCVLREQHLAGAFVQRQHDLGQGQSHHQVRCANSAPRVTPPALRRTLPAATSSRRTRPALIATGAPVNLAQSPGLRICQLLAGSGQSA